MIRKGDGSMSEESKAPELWDLVWQYVFEPYGMLGLVLFAFLAAAIFVWTNTNLR